MKEHDSGKKGRGRGSEREGKREGGAQTRERGRVGRDGRMERGREGGRERGTRWGLGAGMRHRMVWCGMTWRDKDVVLCSRVVWWTGD